MSLLLCALLCTSGVPLCDDSTPALTRLAPPIISLAAVTLTQEAPPTPAGPDPDPEQTGIKAEVQPARPTGPTLDDEELARKRRNADLALLLLWGIIILGVFLLSLALLLGSRYRRIARLKGKPTRSVDPFWYLHTDPHAGNPAQARREQEKSDADGSAAFPDEGGGGDGGDGGGD